MAHTHRYEFCTQHLAVHTTGWCTVPEELKIPLQGQSEAEANAHWERLKDALRYAID